MISEKTSSSSKRPSGLSIDTDLDKSKVHGAPKPDLLTKGSSPRGPPAPPFKKQKSFTLPSLPDISEACVLALRRKGIPAKSCVVDPKVLKGGYICATRRVQIGYDDGADVKWPRTAVVKSIDERCEDHSIAQSLKLYDREFHYYETLQPLLHGVVRSPKYLGTVTMHGEKHGVLMEDLQVPGAILCPSLDLDGVLVTVEHCARYHAKFWNSKDLEGLGVQPHNGSWFNPIWKMDVQRRWRTFRQKWGDTLGDLLPLGDRLQNHFQWVQNEISKEPRTLLHGDVKPGNMFMLPDDKEADVVPNRWRGMTPAYIDWQYTAIGKGCADLVFFLIEGYTPEKCAEMEPVVKKAYLEALKRNGVKNYQEWQLDRDWQLAAMYFPFYVAMWFGNVPDEDLVDPSFPKRFVPRCFEAIKRLRATTILPHDSSSAEECCVEALQRQGIPAKSVAFDQSLLKGGYICATRRIWIQYNVNQSQEFSAGTCKIPKRLWPRSAVLKSVDPECEDHSIACSLKLYDREWHFYEKMQPAMGNVVRTPQHYGTVIMNEEVHGVILEDLGLPGAVLSPQLDMNGVLCTVEHCARYHAKFWNKKEELLALGVQPHNGSWFNPSWRNDVQHRWETFKPKWESVLGPDMMLLGEKVQRHYQFIQNEMSKEPCTFVHGDVKPGNMFMIPDDDEDAGDKGPSHWRGMVPAYIDWQYTAIGKGCADLVFFLIEGYTEHNCAEMEPVVKAAYLQSLARNGIHDYESDDLDRDWKLAAMYFPFYVAMWFGNIADADLVDPSFPKRFVPRCFEAIKRLDAISVLPS